MRALMAGDAVSELKDGVDVYDITVQLPESAQASVETLAEPAGALDDRRSSSTSPTWSTSTRGEGPSQIERQARQRQITVLAGLEGLPLGEATEGRSTRRRRGRPRAPRHRLRRHGRHDGRVASATWASRCFLAVVLVYMILAAQFDSFVQPFTIMLSLPLSVIGAFGGAVPHAA